MYKEGKKKFNKIDFKFKYVSNLGHPTSYLPLVGRITNEYILLNQNHIYFEDIHTVEIEGKNVLIILNPFAIISSEITENLINDTTGFIIKTIGTSAERLKAHLDKRHSRYAVFDQIKSLDIPEENQEYYKTKDCPKCNSLVDINGYKSSQYIYCKHCESIFDRHGEIMPNTKDYKICPQCGFYGRVREYSEFDWFWYPKYRLFYRKHYCCDTCAIRLTEKNFIPNLTFSLGFLHVIHQRLRVKTGINPEYKGLEKANRYAQEMNFPEAETIYNSILTRYKEHPGILYNFGVGLYMSGKKERAAIFLERSLAGCSNYLPTIEFIKDYPIV